MECKTNLPNTSGLVSGQSITGRNSAALNQRLKTSLLGDLKIPKVIDLRKQKQEIEKEILKKIKVKHEENFKRKKTQKDEKVNKIEKENLMRHFKMESKAEQKINSIIQTTKNPLISLSEIYAKIKTASKTHQLNLKGPENLDYLLSTILPKKASFGLLLNGTTAEIKRQNSPFCEFLMAKIEKFNGFNFRRKFSSASSMFFPQISNYCFEQEINIHFVKYLIKSLENELEKCFFDFGEDEFEQLDQNYGLGKLNKCLRFYRNPTLEIAPVVFARKVSSNKNLRNSYRQDLNLRNKRNISTTTVNFEAKRNSRTENNRFLNYLTIVHKTSNLKIDVPTHKQSKSYLIKSKTSRVFRKTELKIDPTNPLLFPDEIMNSARNSCFLFSQKKLPKISLENTYKSNFKMMSAKVVERSLKIRFETKDKILGFRLRSYF